MKTCTRCGLKKSTEEFPKHKRAKDGLYSHCRDCKRESKRVYRQANPEKRRAEMARYRAKYPNTPQLPTAEKTARRNEQFARYRETHRGELVDRNAAWRKDNPLKQAAKSAVSAAVASNAIERPQHCSECSRVCDPQGHHDDYSKPLEVRWLCPPCHQLWHRDNGPGLNGVADSKPPVVDTRTPWDRLQAAKKKRASRPGEGVSKASRRGL